MLFKVPSWIPKGKDLPIEISKGAPGSAKRMLFSGKARKQSLSEPESDGLGWFNEGSGSVSFLKKR